MLANPALSPESEKAVLGASLMNASVCDAAFEIVEPGDFYTRAHQILARAILEIRNDDSMPLNLVTLYDQMQNRGELENVGGAVYLNRLLDVGYSDAQDIVCGHARQVADASAKRKLAALGAEMSEFPANLTPEAQINMIQQRLDQIQRKLVTAGPPSMNTLATDVLNKIEARSKCGLDVTGVSTGFRHLDTLTAGLHAGDLIIVAARPSVGKTALAIQMALDVLQSGRPVLFFSLEMSAHQITERLFALVSLVDSGRLRSGRLREADWEPLGRARTLVGAFPLVIEDRAALSMKDVRLAARRHHDAGELTLVVVDYLQLLRGAKAENRNLEVASISRDLKALARELAVPVVALSQLSRGSSHRNDKRPALFDLRDSGALEQDADVVFMLHRDDIQDLTDRAAELVVAKQRNGPTGSVTLEFDAARARFIEVLASPMARRVAS